MRLFVLGALALIAVVSQTDVSVAQVESPSRTFKNGPDNVTVFDGASVFEAQFEIPLVPRESVEILSVPVEVNVPSSRRSLLVIQFLGQFRVPLMLPVTLLADCTVDHVANTAYGCGLTSAADFDLNVRPLSGLANAMFPATFLVRNLPQGTHQIGVAISVESPMSFPPNVQASFAPASSSLIVSLYSDKDR